MKLKKLTLLDFEPEFFDKPRMQRLKGLTDELNFINELDFKKQNDHLKETDALIVRYFSTIDRETIESMPNLKYIGASSVSVDQIDVNYAKKKGVVVTNLAGYSTDAVAEFVFAALLTDVRHLFEAKVNLARNDFAVHSNYQGFELNGKTFGILGLGSIGKKVAEIALGFGMKVQYWSRQRKEQEENKGIKYSDMKTLLQNSDILGIFLELNEETKGIFTKNDIKLVKKGAVVISPSHTDIFDFPALMEALDENQFRFIQTYFSTISDKNRETLHQNKNVVLYPSIGIQTKETKERMQEMIVRNIENFCRGKAQNQI